MQFIDQKLQRIWDKVRLNVRISPEEAIQAWLDLRAGKFVAIHWGTFALAREPYDEPPKRIAEEIGRRSLDARAVWILKPGETTAW